MKRLSSSIGRKNNIHRLGQSFSPNREQGSLHSPPTNVAPSYLRAPQTAR